MSDADAVEVLPAEQEKRAGKYKQLTAGELAQIAELTSRGHTPRQIARLLGRNKTSIYNALQRPDAKELLKHNEIRAVKSWVACLDSARRKGNHNPAKDLLLHLGVIDPIQERTSTVQINLGIQLNTDESK